MGAGRRVGRATEPRGRRAGIATRIEADPQGEGLGGGEGGGCSTAVGGPAVSVRASTVAVSPTRPVLRGRPLPVSYAPPPLPTSGCSTAKEPSTAPMSIAVCRPSRRQASPPGTARHAIAACPPPSPPPPLPAPLCPPPARTSPGPPIAISLPPFRSPPPPHPTAHPHSRRSPCSAARTRPGRPTRTAVARGGPRGWGGTGAAARPARRCRTPPPSPSRSRRAAAGPRGQSHTSRVRPALARAPHEASRGGRGACC